LSGLNDKAIGLETEKKKVKNSREDDFERVREHPYRKDGTRLRTTKKTG